MLSSRFVNTDPDAGVGGTIALVVAWPAFWDFSHSGRLTHAAVLSANPALDELVIIGPRLYPRDPVAGGRGGRR
ncbi:hypothetical protein NGR_b16740 (plasmid) [Sinorhizobium fredii NGR234]|nr:hypothetical protein NGR_b16740 [Sinorhizobium fredii NGR234]